MLDNAFATKRFTRNAARQANKTKTVSTFRFSEAARYAFPSAANSRNKILAINVLLDRPNCLLLLSYGVLTVTDPSDVLYKP